MNSFFRNTAVAGMLVAGMVACKKDETRLSAEFGPAPVLTASTTDAGVLTLANTNVAAITFNWTPYAFALTEGASAASPVTYTLQIDRASGNFSAPKEFNAGAAANGVVSRAVKTGELNTTLLDMMLPFGQVAQVKVRLKTMVGGNQAPLYSEAKAFSVTPYNACVAPGTFSWGLVGPAADGWPGPPTTDRELPYVCGTTNAFFLRTTLTANNPGTDNKLKFRANRDWATNLGAATSAVTPVVIGTPMTLSLGGGDLTLPTAGTYNVKLVVTLSAAGAVTGGTLTVTP